MELAQVLVVKSSSLLEVTLARVLVVKLPLRQAQGLQVVVQFSLQRDRQRVPE
jgi:hypothetical protein